MPAKLQNRTMANLKNAWERVVAGDGDRRDFRILFLVWNRHSLYNQILLLNRLKDKYPRTFEIVNEKLTPDAERVFL